jgi:hypothetical protein
MFEGLTSLGVVRVQFQNGLDLCPACRAHAEEVQPLAESLPVDDSQSTQLHSVLAVLPVGKMGVRGQRGVQRHLQRRALVDVVTE